MGFPESLVVGLLAAVALFVPVYDVSRRDRELTESRDVRVLAASMSLPWMVVVAIMWPVERLGVQDADAAVDTALVGVYLFLTLMYWGYAASVRSPFHDG